MGEGFVSADRSTCSYVSLLEVNVIHLSCREDCNVTI